MEVGIHQGQQRMEKALRYLDCGLPVSLTSSVGLEAEMSSCRLGGLVFKEAELVADDCCSIGECGF